MDEIVRVPVSSRAAAGLIVKLAIDSVVESFGWLDGPAGMEAVSPL